MPTLIWLAGEDGPVAVDAERVAALQEVPELDRMNRPVQHYVQDTDAVETRMAGTKIILTGLMAPVVVKDRAAEIAQKMMAALA